MKSPHPLRMEQILHTAIRSITPFRKNWCIETAQQKWIAKRMRFPTRLQWWRQVDHELRLRGFMAMPFFMTDGKEWLLTPWIEGKTGCYANETDVTKMLQVLAHFHLTGRRLHTPLVDKAHFTLHERIHDRLVQFYQVFKKSSSIQGELGELIRTHGKDFYLDGMQTWQQLERLPLREITYEERALHHLNHRDLASHNWIIDPNGQPWLIDFETAEYDCQLGDVWQMGTRILSVNNWSDSWIERFFRDYEVHRPLSAVEKKIIATLFSFPNEFFREAIGLVEKKRGYHARFALPYLQRLVDNRVHWRLQIRRIFSC
jgi:hypothetical protein